MEFFVIVSLFLMYYHYICIFINFLCIYKKLKSMKKYQKNDDFNEKGGLWWKWEVSWGTEEAQKGLKGGF